MKERISTLKLTAATDYSAVHQQTSALIKYLNTDRLKPSQFLKVLCLNRQQGNSNETALLTNKVAVSHSIHYTVNS